MPNRINWNATITERDLARRIARRAYDKFAARDPWGEQDYEMDVLACHLNGCPLRLFDLLNADDFNFTHDIVGIREHLDRRTGRLSHRFRPRFVQRETAQ